MLILCYQIHFRSQHPPNGALQYLGRQMLFFRVWKSWESFGVGGLEVGVFGLGVYHKLSSHGNGRANGRSGASTWCANLCGRSIRQRTRTWRPFSLPIRAHLRQIPILIGCRLSLSAWLCLLFVLLNSSMNRGRCHPSSLSNVELKT